MNIKKLFSKYKENQAAIILYQREIEIRKRDLFPNMINTLSLVPVAHENTSTVESTVEKYEKDLDIRYFEEQIARARYDIQTVDALMALLNEETRNLIQMRLIEGKKPLEIAETLGICERDVYRKTNDALDKMDMLVYLVEYATKDKDLKDKKCQKI